MSESKKFRELHPVAKIAVGVILTGAALLAATGLGLLVKLVAWAWS